MNAPTSPSPAPAWLWRSWGKQLFCTLQPASDLVDISLPWDISQRTHHIWRTKVWGSSPERYSQHIPAKVSGLLCFKNNKDPKPTTSETFAEQYRTRIGVKHLLYLPSLQRSHSSGATHMAALYFHRDLSLPHFAERYFLCKHLFGNSLFLLPDMIFLHSELMINN